MSARPEDGFACRKGDARTKRGLPKYPAFILLVDSGLRRWALILDEMIGIAGNVGDLRRTGGGIRPELLEKWLKSNYHRIVNKEG